MKITARLGTDFMAARFPRGDLSPIVSDLPALERAMTTLVQTSNAHAAALGREPEADLMIGELRSDHGIMAALIADPASEAFRLAGSLLARRLRDLTTPDERNIVAARIIARADPKRRYDGDHRQRH